MTKEEIPIIIKKNLTTYEYDSFARGFHAYMDIWNPLIGEILKYKREPTKEVDKHAAAIMRSNSFGKEFSAVFLMILLTSIEVEVADKRLNRGGGYGLEILVKYRFYGQENIVQWLTKKLETVRKGLEYKISEFLK